MYTSFSNTAPSLIRKKTSPIQRNRHEAFVKYEPDLSKSTQFLREEIIAKFSKRYDERINPELVAVYAQKIKSPEDYHLEANSIWERNFPINKHGHRLEQTLMLRMNLRLAELLHNTCSNVLDPEDRRTQALAIKRIKIDLNIKNTDPFIFNSHKGRYI